MIYLVKGTEIAELVCVSGWELICVVLVSEVQISPSVIVFVALVGLGVSIDSLTGSEACSYFSCDPLVLYWNPSEVWVRCG